jgi:hypothetical protein
MCNGMEIVVSPIYLYIQHKFEKVISVHLCLIFCWLFVKYIVNCNHICWRCQEQGWRENNLNVYCILVHERLPTKWDDKISNVYYLNFHSYFISACSRHSLCVVLIADIFCFQGHTGCLCKHNCQQKPISFKIEIRSSQPASSSIPSRTWVFNKEVTLFEIDYMDLWTRVWHWLLFVSKLALATNRLC